MIEIGICDDEKEYRDMLYEMVVRSLFQFDEVEFRYYETGNQIIEEIEKNEFKCDLLLLDINMPGRNGLKTAEYIRTHQVDVDIIFVTVSAEHVFDGYTYQAFSYLVKPLEYGRLSDELKRYVKLKENTSKCLHVNIGGKKVQIFLDRVKYFAADGRKIFVCERGRKDMTSFYAKIGELQEILQGYDFLRCHHSYLVNSRYVSSYSRTEIDVDSEKLPVSRRYAEEIRNYFDSQGGSRI